MTEATRAVPESAPALDLGRRVFARHARAEGRLSPWTRRDLAGKTIVRELRFAQHIARRVYGRGAPGVTFEGQLSPNAPRGVARFSEKVAERNTLADVARKYAPADEAEAGATAAKTAGNGPMPLAGAGSGESSGPRNAGPAISAAEALQRLAVVRPDLDPESSPFAKIFKAATGGAQSSESTPQRRSNDSARRVVETFQRGGPRPKADATPPPAPVRPRTDGPQAPIQRRVDPSAQVVPAPPPAATPAPERPPATPSSRALRRFARVEEVVPPNFTPPSDDFGDDLPEPSGPAIQRALPPVPGDVMPLARRPIPAPAPTVVQAKRPTPPTAPAPKRQARPAPAPARLQRRAAAPAARPAGQPAPGARPPGQIAPAVEAPGRAQHPVADAGGAATEPPFDLSSERQAPRPTAPIQRTPDRAPAAPPISGGQPPALEQDSAIQAPPAAGSPDPSDAGAPLRAPIQREAGESSNSDLPLAQPARPGSAPGDILQRTPAARETPAPRSDPTPRETASTPSDDSPPARPVARDLPADASPGTTAQRKPVGSSAESPPRDAASSTLPPVPIQRTPSAGQTAELPIAHPEPPTERPPAAGPGPVPLEPPPPTPIQRQTDDAPPASPIQRQTIADQAVDLPLARPPEPPPARPAASPLPHQPIADRPADSPVSPIQRRQIVDQPADLPLARTPEPPAIAPPAPIQRQPTEGPAADPAPAQVPAAPIQRQRAAGQAADLPLARTSEPPDAESSRSKQPTEGPPIHPTGAAPASAPAAPIQRQPGDVPAVLPLARPSTPEAPQPAISDPRIQSKEAQFPTGMAPAPEESGEAPVKPAAIRPRSSALNLARRAVQRMLGEGPQPAAAVPGQPEQARPTGGGARPTSGPGEAAGQSARREQEPRPDLALRRAPAPPMAPQEPGSGAPIGPTARAETGTGAPRAAPIPARIQRSPAPMSTVPRAGRGGEAIAAGPDTDDSRRSFDRDDSLPLVVPLLAAQSQSASRHIQRAEVSGPSGEPETRTAPETAPRRKSASRPAGYSSEPAPKVGLKAPVPDQPAPSKGSEPDLNYDLLAQRVYPFIRRLLAFERERERGS